MPSGERTVTGLTLLLQHVDRHSAGQYQCSADNGVAQPDTRFINLVVKCKFALSMNLSGFYKMNLLPDPPEVETERTSVHTGIGMEAQLVCLVHAEPAPHVTWYKDTTQLGTTEKHATQTRGNRHTLIIRNVSAADFGNYRLVLCNKSSLQVLIVVRNYCRTMSRERIVFCIYRGVTEKVNVRLSVSPIRG